MWEFVAAHSHEISCWACALGICSGLFIFMVLIDAAWNQAYKKGYDKALEDNDIDKVNP